MRKTTRSLLVFIAFFIMSAPLMAFIDSPVYAANSNWASLVENVCGKSMDGYDVAYKSQCTEGIGQIYSYCTARYPGSSNSSSERTACDHGVYWSDVKANQPEPKGEWVQNHCSFLNTNENSLDTYECQGASPWPNGQGFCSVFHTVRPGGGRDSMSTVFTAQCASTAGDSAHTTGPTDQGTLLADSEKNCWTDVGFFNYAVCSITNGLGDLVDMLIDQVIASMQWRIL